MSPSSTSIKSDASVSLFFEQIPPSFQGYVEQFRKHPKKAIQRLQKAIQRRHTGAAGYAVLAMLYAMNGEKEQAVHHAWTAGILAPGSHHFRQLPFLIMQMELDAVEERYKSASGRANRNGPAALTNASEHDESNTRSRQMAARDLRHPAMQMQRRISSERPSAIEFAVSDLDHFIDTLSSAGTGIRRGRIDPQGSKVPGHQPEAVPEKEVEFPTASDGKNAATTGSKTMPFMGQQSPVVSETLANIYADQGHYQDAIAMYAQLIERFPDRKDEFEQKTAVLKKKSSNSGDSA